MKHRLPDRIALVVAVSILLIVAAAALAIIWMTRVLDRQALEQSQVQVAIVRDNLLERMNILLVDYTKWDAAFTATQGQGNMEWMIDNIGSAALISEAVQLAVIWGGSFTQDFGWIEGGPQEPRPGVLPASTLTAAERGLSEAEPGGFDTTQFFGWRDDELFVFGASHFEPVKAAERISEDERLGARLIMGVKIDEEDVEEIVQDLSLTGVGIARDLPSDGRPARPLPGPDGEPVAYIVWDPPQPGTAVLRQMLPFLVLLTAGAAVLAALNMQYAKRGAQDLVVAERQATRASRTDALTGLLNRAAFQDALAARARRGERAILFLDIDDFKRINDSIGHAAGDQVIIAVSRRLANLVDPGCLLARIGGDEFVIVLEGPDAEVRARSLAQRVEGALATPFSVMGHQLSLRTAIGYAVQTDEDTTGDDLVRQADLAMYGAKRQREGGPVAFSHLLETATRDAALIEQGLRRALDRPGELSVVYQPIAAMDGRMVRAEALARWTSPELGSVPPNQFIAVAERTGLIIDLGRRLIDLVCRDLAAHPDLKVSLNVSPLQLMAPDFIPGLVRDLSRYGVDVPRVEIELTESVIVDDTRLAAERFEELHAAGFSIALDDFGTGYSSMGYLARLRFHTLKIDRSFVSKVLATDQDAAVVDGMIRIAHGLGLQVVCEGIETAEELGRLREFGCDLAQGYHLDRPLPIHALAGRWLPHPTPSGAVVGL